jgi:acyl-CoA synthetase (AMP-forming)/AMP-acid ligase II/pimeloyl-ACP methyl ester carboxylesterase
VTQPASLPPAGLPGLDPRWSRLVTARDGDGVPRTWHVLDTHADHGTEDDQVDLTLLCVHGNPTWSYLWRRLLATAPPGVRVVAVDQMDMGYSERTSGVRRLAQRVDDLAVVAEAAGIRGPVVTVAHDWGGPISLGWVLGHRDRVRGVVLLNTAVHQPEGAPAPAVIRLARTPALLRTGTVSTPAFVRATTGLSGPSMPRQVAAAYAAPYATPDRREAVGAFVADIPLEPEHPSAPALDAIADGVRELDVPVLLLWGPGDPVFSDRYLRDLLERMPHADVHRYEGARHLVSEDAAGLVDDLWQWVADLQDADLPDTGASSTGVGFNAAVPPTADEPWLPLDAALVARAEADPDGVALAEPHAGGWRRVTWSLLARRVDELARGLHARGVHHGDRVAVLITPGADLLATVYACWRIGASVVVTDAGLGARGIHRALRGAAPDHVIAIPRGMALVRATRLPGVRIPVGDLPAIARLGASLPPQVDRVAPEDEAVVAFTSGSTGPAKGVVYRHRQVRRTVDLLQQHYRIGPDDALVAAFAPWAVLGPALGIPSAIPDMDVTSPRTLEARAQAAATAAVGGTLVWASPAALTSILRTADRLDDRQFAALGTLRLVMGAGAPVAPALLHGMGRLCPNAELRTPYGMTEVLPVADVSIDEIDAAGPGDGVVVGRPLPGVDVRISAVDAEGRASGPLTDEPGTLGEVVVRAPHVKDRYDRLWATQRRASRDGGWHRTGDVGRLDADGRLWIGGRLAHVITTPDGPRAPVGVEQAAERVPEVVQAAAVGVGPVGTQQVVVVVVPTIGAGSGRLADLDLAAAVRREVHDALGVPVAAVLQRDALPVDIRHNSKIDRAHLASWATGVLAGRA